MDYLIVAGISILGSLLSGGYLGYKYGRRVELKAREAYEAVEAEVKSKLGK